MAIYSNISRFTFFIIIWPHAFVQSEKNYNWILDTYVYYVSLKIYLKK